MPHTEEGGAGMNYALERAHRSWLNPDSGRRSAGCRCAICGESVFLSCMYELGGKTVCEDCVDDGTFPFDVYPDEEESDPICSVCGYRCTECAIRLLGVTYCTDCAEEGRMQDDQFFAYI